MPDLPPPPVESAQTFDLADLTRRDLRVVKPRCAPPVPGEIVVCAADPEKERLRPLPELPHPLPPGEIALSDSLNLGVRVDGATVGGTPSNRAMVDVKIRF